MIRRLAADLDDLREAVEMTGAALDRSQQLLRLEMVGARTGHEDAVALQELDRQLIEPAIGRLALGDVLLALDEGRRVDHDDVEAALFGMQLLHHVEGVAANRRGLQTVRRGRRLQTFQGRC
jgi:hypothetical protein